VDRMANERVDKSKPLRVLSLAAGHGREISLSHAFKRNEVSFAALDLDELSLRQLAQDYGQYSVELYQWHVKLLLQQEAQNLIGKFDLVYSCGLYDYLPDSFATKLTEAIASRLLKPGGKLILVNFVDHYFRNWMEIFMDWHLIYRDVASLEQLTAVIPPNMVARKSLFKDPSGAVLFVEIDLEQQAVPKSVITPTFYEVFNLPLHRAKL